MGFLLQNGLVVDPGSGLCDIRDVYIEGDIVRDIAESIDVIELAKKDAELKCVDCSDMIVGPGLVDVHVHFRDPGFTYKEDIESGALAAARGGVTSVVLMANTKPVVDSPDTLGYVLDKGRNTPIHVYSCSSITKGLKGEELVDFDEMLKAGAAGFTDDGIPILSEEIVRKAMEASAKTSSVLSFHEENPKYITNNGINRGMASAHYNIEGSDRMAEITMVERDLELAVSAGACVNFQHISTKEAVDAIRQAKKKYPEAHIYCEATPHHIALNEEAAIKFGTNAKMNPPLRCEEDRLAIIAGLQDGTIDVIATDHAPHSEEEKAKAITDAPSGIIGLETSLCVTYDTLVRGGKLSILQLFCKNSYNPSKIYGLDAGELAIGRKADLVVFDPNRVKNCTEFQSKSCNSPYFGASITGDVVMTICSGKVAYNNLTIR